MIGQSVGSDASPLSCFLFRPRKNRKSAGNTVIPTYPTRWSHGLQHLRHKRPTFAFTGESGCTLGFPRKIAHKGSHAETGVFRTGGGITTLGLFHTFRKPCVARGQNGVLCRFGILAGRCSRRTQKAFGTAMRLCASLFRGVAAPLGCVIFFTSAEVAACTPCAQCFPNVRDEGWYHYPRRALCAVETLGARLSK